LAGLVAALPLTKRTGLLAADAAADGRVAVLAAAIVDLFSHETSARMIGLRYLDQNPTEASFDTLLDKLLVDLPELRSDFPGGSRAARAKLLREQVRREFELGSLVRIGGWVLSVFEARLCAFAALLP
jgi:hypothetical protein